jgi:hypothetical protein
MKLRELVGECQECKKEIYCENGFFNGIVKEDGKITCFDCEEKKEKNEV